MMQKLVATLAFLLISSCPVRAQPVPVPAKEPAFAGKSLAHWIGRLKDENPLFREEAVVALGEMGPAAREALALLRPLLKAESSWLRLRAAVAVWKIERQSQVVLPVFLDCLRGENSLQRIMAIQAIGQLGAEAIPAAPDLVALLDNTAGPPRGLATIALRAMGADAIPALTTGLSKGSAETRRVCLQMLSPFAATTPQVRDALTERLNDEDRTVRLEAVAALMRTATAPKLLAAVLAEGVNDKQAAHRSRATSLVFQVSPRSREFLEVYTALLDDSETPVACAAAQAVWDVTGDAKRIVPTLNRLLNDPAHNVQIRTMQIVRQMGLASRHCLPALLNGPAGKNSWNVTEVVRLSGPAILPDLLEAIKKKVPNRIQVIEALYATGEEATTPLLKLLDDAEVEVRDAAARSLGRLGGFHTSKATEIIPALLQMSKSEIASSRVAAIHGLGLMGTNGKTAIPGILDAFKDKELTVRRAALSALDWISPPPGITLPVLDTAMKDDPDLALRFMAAQLRLKLTDDPGPAVPFLVGMMNERGFDRNAIVLLGQLGPKARAAVPQLLDYVREENDQRISTRCDALKAVVKIEPQSKLLPPLVHKFLGHKMAIMRYTAIEAAAVLGLECDATPLIADLRVTRSHAFLSIHRTLRKLGPKAKGLTPFLLEQSRSSAEPERIAAAETLCKVAPEHAEMGKKILLDSLGEGKTVNYEVARSVLAVDDRNERALKIFETALAGTDRREIALAILSQADFSARGTLPAVKRLLGDLEHSTRLAAAQAYWKISGEAEPALAVILPILQREELVMFHEQALAQLVEMGGDAKAAVPVLSELAKKLDAGRRTRLVQTIGKIDPSAARDTDRP